MRWESDLVYYRDLNLGVQERLGVTLLADAARGVKRVGALS